MFGSEDLMLHAHVALAEMDRCLGQRMSGMAISGATAPSFKHISTGEDPTRFTSRVLVEPVVRGLGYGVPVGPSPDPGRPHVRAGTVMVTGSMNRDMGKPERDLVMAMRAEGASRGMATDGFRWVFVRGTGLGLGMTRVDLRPYYVEVLDRSRFRSAAMADRRDAVRFVEVFRRKPRRGARRGTDDEEGEVVQGMGFEPTDH